MTRNQRTQAEARVASTLDAMTDEARAAALARLARRDAKVRRQFGPVPRARASEFAHSVDDLIDKHAAAALAAAR